MTLKIINEKERLKYEHSSGAIFYYRRIRWSEHRAIEKKATRGGMIDYEAVGFEAVKKCLIDWENVVDEELQPVKYDPELIDGLPNIILQGLYIAIRGSSGIEEDEQTEKN